MVYETKDAPNEANSAQGALNLVRARRDSVRGWLGVGLSPPLSAPVTAFGSITTVAISQDLLSTLEETDQPLSGRTDLTGKNLFVGRADGRYRLVTNVGTPIGGFHDYPQGVFDGGTPDFSTIYFQPVVAQLSSDPVGVYNTYVWSEDRGLRLLGILPDGTPAPNGAGFAGASTDGKYVAFTADGRLYVRIDDSRTVEAGASQRTVVPDPNPAPAPATVSITADGSKILFTSTSELTDDANTGESGGVATDAGRDLYSYDIATGRLTDLTVDTDLADAATGANIQPDAHGLPFVRSAPDGSHIYFTATGHLAEGATPGHVSLYVWHDNQVDFVADASGMGALSMTPNGRHIAFESTADLTGYDSTDPVSGQPHTEIFEKTLGSEIECASCRADGRRPTGESTLPVALPLGPIRVMSDDGRRVFFHSTDAVLPQAASGLQQVFEYADGRVSAISRVDASSAATFLDASASGDDVFFETYDEKLVPSPDGGDDAVFDARVGGGFPIRPGEVCANAVCQPVATPAPVLPIAASVTIGEGDTQEPAEGSPSSLRVTVSKVKMITGTAGSLRVKVPGKGRLTISGSGLQTKRSNPAKAETITVRLALTSRATKSLRKGRSLRIKVKVAFSSVSGRASTTTLSVTFKAKAGATRKGR